VTALGPALGWIVFGAVHSALASRAGTSFLVRRFGAHHRLVFSGISMAMLLPALVYSLLVRGEPLLRWEGPLAVVRFAMLAAAGALFWAGSRHFSMRRLLGFAQLRAGGSVGLASRGRLDSSGVLGLIRHPWYTGTLLLVWAGRDLDLSALATNLVLTVYVVVGTLLEERKLVAEFGDEYRAYQRRVSMLVPLKWAGTRLRGPALGGRS
jgi:protein-S-isoprenylcysteine O-methyltransferase Ste14